MKNYKTILQAIKNNADAIAAKEAQIEDLELRFEKQAAHRAGDMEKVKELAQASRANDEQIAAICEDIYRIKIENAILLENARASFAAHALKIIAAECSKYNGKQYGEKTKDKIQEAVRAKGIGFYFQGIVSKTTINIYALNSEGYHAIGRDLEIELYTRNYNKPFITEDNKLDFDIDNVHQRYTYTGSPATQVNKIIKTYKAYQAAMEKASAAEKALNNILPETLPDYHNASGYIKPLTY